MDISRMARTTGVLLCNLLLLGACQGGGLARPGGAAGSPGGGSRIKEVVTLSGADLAAVDAHFRAGSGGSNTRWIVGDEVDVIASEEYFSQILTVNRGPMVTRTDRMEGEATLITLQFVGGRNQASAMNNPRVQIGTGLTVIAARIMRLRMLPTTSSSMPVRLNVIARGNASRGHKDEVLERGEQLTTGGNLVQRAGRWTWVPTGS